MSSNYISKNTSKSSAIASNLPQKRYTSDLKVDPKLMSALIGVGGCNIRRITNLVRHGCYIRGENDTFKVTAYTKEALKQAMNILRQDERALKDPSNSPTKPTTSMDVDISIVPHIVGKGGSGLKVIMTRVGDGCFIVHKNDQFLITANSQRDLEKAKEFLQDEVDKYTALMEEHSRTTRKHLTVVLPKVLEDEADEPVIVHPKPLPITSHKSIDNSNQFAILDDDVEDIEETRVPTPIYRNAAVHQRQFIRQEFAKQLNIDFKDVPDKLVNNFIRDTIDEFPTLAGIPKRDNITPNITLEIEKKNPTVDTPWGDKSKLSSIIESVKVAKFEESERVRQIKQEEVKKFAQKEQQEAHRLKSIHKSRPLVVEEVIVFSDDEDEEPSEEYSDDFVQEPEQLSTPLPRRELLPAPVFKPSKALSWADMCDEDSDDAWN
jgi:hypothetical protein